MTLENRKTSGDLRIPGGARRLVLHCCCAPCAGGILETLTGSGVEVFLFFYNPNIHPRDEYLRRKEEMKAFAARLGVVVVDADYAPEAWFGAVDGLEDTPERGERCQACFRMRLEATAEYAEFHGFEVFATTLGISRWKDLEQVNAAGHAVATRHAGVSFWPVNWRKQGGAQRMLEVTRREGFYQQPYCGCVFSLRDANRRRVEKGQEIIDRDISECDAWQKQ